MQPQNVNPAKFKQKAIVYTSPDGSFSIAIGEWTDDRMNRFAMRWNGDINDPNSLGYPSQGGNPLWFQLPYDIKDVLSCLITHSTSMTLP